MLDVSKKLNTTVYLTADFHDTIKSKFRYEYHGSEVEEIKMSTVYSLKYTRKIVKGTKLKCAVEYLFSTLYKYSVFTPLREKLMNITETLRECETTDVLSVSLNYVEHIPCAVAKPVE